MTTKQKQHIAGESLEILVRGLADMDVDKQSNGMVHVRFKLDPEIGTAWARAIERYGADFIGVGNRDTLQQRHADASLRICNEIAELLPHSTATSQEHPDHGP
jgi:hypothetical protein